MSKTILLNNLQKHFDNKGLPILIHGKEHTGSSLFTISLLVDLYFQGYKIIFLSGYQMAREEFIKQIGTDTQTVLANPTDSLENLNKKQVIFVRRKNPELFISFMHGLADINKRVVLVKNIDLFDESIFSAIENNSRVIISGDIDRSLYKSKIIKKHYSTKIIFSKPNISLNMNLPLLKKYEGFLWSEAEQGIVSLA